MINKVIHYCWFGHNKKPKIIEKCIKSWKKYCPDFEIKEWNEDNFDINCCKYVKEAYESKKWAFVSDYARFYILNKEGGIYLDTDVELIKPLDEYLNKDFTAFETYYSVATGLIMGCHPNNSLCTHMLEEYNSDKFILEDGSLNVCTVCNRVTNYLKSKGLVLEDKTQEVDGYTIYDSSYFNPTNMDTGKICLKDNTVSIHHYAGSWVPKKDRIRGKIYYMIRNIFGEKIATKIRKVVGRK